MKSKQPVPVLISSPRRMTRLSLIAVLFLCSLAVPGALRAQQQPEWKIEALSEESEVEYSFNGIMIATNGVVITYGDAVLAADRVTGAAVLVADA